MENEKTEQLDKILGRDIYSDKRSKALMTTGPRVVLSCHFYMRFQKIFVIFLWVHKGVQRISRIWTLAVFEFRLKVGNLQLMSNKLAKSPTGLSRVQVIPIPTADSGWNCNNLNSGQSWVQVITILTAGSGNHAEGKQADKKTDGAEMWRVSTEGRA